MTFWDFLVTVWEAFWRNGTKILGIAQGTVSILAGMIGLIPESHLKYYLAASAVLTFWRGQYNADQIAQKVIDKQPVNPALEIK